MRSAPGSPKRRARNQEHVVSRLRFKATWMPTPSSCCSLALFSSPRGLIPARRATHTSLIVTSPHKGSLNPLPPAGPADCLSVSQVPAGRIRMAQPRLWVRSSVVSERAHSALGIGRWRGPRLWKRGTSQQHKPSTRPRVALDTLDLSFKLFQPP